MTNHLDTLSSSLEILLQTHPDPIPTYYYYYYIQILSYKNACSVRESNSLPLALEANVVTTSSRLSSERLMQQ